MVRQVLHPLLRPLKRCALWRPVADGRQGQTPMRGYASGGGARHLHLFDRDGHGEGSAQTRGGNRETGYI